MRAAFAAAALVFCAGCFRSTRIEKRSLPVDTGVPVTFGALGGEPLRWEISDGSAPTVGATLEHAFARAGHYAVVGKSGERVAWRVELDAIPRPVTRAVPGDAEWVLFAPTLKGDLDATLDFVERVLGSANVQVITEGWLLPSLAVDASAGEASQIVDPLEGVGLFTLPGLDGPVVLLGVVDEAAAMAESAARARPVESPEHAPAGASTQREDSGASDGEGVAMAGGGAPAPNADLSTQARPGRWLELHDGARVFVFADRGYVFAVFPKGHDDAESVMDRVRRADSHGFEKSPSFTSPMPGGRVVLMGAPTDKTELPIDSLWATLSVGPLEARLEGQLKSKDPVWQTQGNRPLETFRRAREGPIGAVSAKLPVGVLRALLKPGSPERERSRQRLLSHGIDIDRMFRALTGEVAGIAWFDAEAFLRNLIEGNERPEPRGAALVQLSLSDAGPWESAVGQILEVFLPVHPKELHLKNGTAWSTRIAEQDAVFSVADKSLTLEIGSGLDTRTLVDLSQTLAARFDGAFGPGHASLLVDLGRLRAELETPRLISGLDPMRVVTVQGFSSAFLDQLTPVDHVVLDLAPAPYGAKLSGRIVLREKPH